MGPKSVLSAITFVASVTLPGTLFAQSVRGTVTRVGTPIPGVVVQLLDSTSTIVSRMLSDERGMYRLRAPRGGTYRLATRRIGFVPSISRPFVLVDGEITEQPLPLDGIAISLDTVRVKSVRGACGKTDVAAAEVRAVWEQARTSLMATEASLSGRAISAALLNYQRTRNADGTHVLQSLEMLEVDSVAQPWVSQSFDELERIGYVQNGKESTAYRAPGLDVLISDAFSAKHCFRVVYPADTTRIALSFEPAKPRKGISELTGVLSLDRRTAELRSLDFGYTNIGALLDEAGAGGRMEFVALRDGSWAISRWNIRMPIVGLGQLINRSRSSLAITSTEIGGGDLLVARRGADTLWARALPPVVGVLTDSATGAAITGARLRLKDSDREGLTDATGRFSLRNVLPGDYTVLINTPSLDSLGALTAVPLLVADTVATLAVKVPNARRVLPLVCSVPSDSLAKRSTYGVLRGMVSPPGDSLLSEPAELIVQWRDSVTRTARTQRGRTDDEGRYRLCDVPVGIALDVRAEAQSLTSGSTSIQLSPTSPFVKLNVTLEKLASNQAVLRGDVVDDAGNPVDNVTVEISALGMRSVTDASGSYRLARVPEGKQRVTLRRLGYAPVDADLIVEAGKIMERRFALAKVTALSEVTTTASMAWMKSFDEHRRIGLGVFFTREDLAKQENRRLSDILSGVGGVKLVPLRGNRVALSSSRRPPRLDGVTTCYAQIYRDRTLLYGGREGEPIPNINDLVVGDIEAIEYFNGPATTPAEYSGLQSPCGVLVVHTRQR